MSPSSIFTSLFFVRSSFPLSLAIVSARRRAIFVSVVQVSISHSSGTRTAACWLHARVHHSNPIPPGSLKVYNFLVRPSPARQDLVSLFHCHRQIFCHYRDWPWTMLPVLGEFRPIISERMVDELLSQEYRLRDISDVQLKNKSCYKRGWYVMK